MHAIALQSDSKIIIGGSFTSVAGQMRNYIARLNIDGTIDKDFNPNVNNEVYAIAIQPNGKILIGGRFDLVNGRTCSKIARLEQNGSLDNSFADSVITSADGQDSYGCVYVIKPERDGRILIGGFFSRVWGQKRRNMARLNSDGTLDPTFNLDANNTVFSIGLQQDGKILVGGAFMMIGEQTRSRIARLVSTVARGL